MEDKKTYNRIGKLNRKCTIYAPVYRRNTLGGQIPGYIVLTSLFMEVLPSGGDKTVIADKVTAVKENKFRCRTLSANGIHETMIIRYDGADYHIKYIEEDFTDKKKSFSIITAERNRENINLVQLAELDNIYMGYSQKFLNKTGTTVTVTAGTLPDPNTETETYFHQMLYVFRGGAEMVRVIYGDGYTISGQVITFSNALRGENVLVHQYTEA